MRLYLALAVAFAALSLASAANIFWGERVDNDYLVHHSEIFGNHHLLRKSKSTIQYQTPIVGSEGSIIDQFKNLFLLVPGPTRIPSNITMIKVYDMMPEKSGCRCQLKSGGPGSNYASVTCSSKRDKQLHYILDIYGI